MRVHRVAIGCQTTVAKSRIVKAASTPAAIKEKGSGSCTKLNNDPTMATARIRVLLFVLSATVAQDIKLKYKPSSTPVRLFTEEELRRYDGSEVNFICRLMHNRECFWVFEFMCLSFVCASTQLRHVITIIT